MKRILIVIGLFVLLTITACAGPDMVPPEVESEGLPPVAAVRAREKLSADLDLSIEKVEIIAQEQAEWSDSCLGLGGPAESCLAEITPGWRVELRMEAETYIARTDELGESIRFEEGVVNLPVLPPISQPPEDGSLPEAVLSARRVLADRLNISADKVEIINYEQKSWPNGCLGLAQKEEMCTMATVSGWRVELNADDQLFIARTNETGSHVRFE